jgi:endonuclease YncB( thermonuclease family)
VPVASLLCLRGDLVVVGKSPDGDSIRFRPKRPALVRGLVNGARARRSSDGTFQLRLDGIDAPETHYNGLAQPLGVPARSQLLAWCGFTDVRWVGDTVSASTPASIPAAIQAGLVDANGRPVAFLLRDELPPDGAPAEVALERTANADLLRSGAAYATLYRSTAPELRDAMRALARAARAASLGVWPADRSGGLMLTDQSSIGPDGSLVLPKLFRRCSDYLRSRNPRETLPEWMARMGPQENDQVYVGGAADPVPFSTLVTQHGDRIALDADPLDLVFGET